MASQSSSSIYPPVLCGYCGTSPTVVDNRLDCPVDGCSCCSVQIESIMNFSSLSISSPLPPCEWAGQVSEQASKQAGKASSWRPGPITQIDFKLKRVNSYCQPVWTNVKRIVCESNSLNKTYCLYRMDPSDRLPETSWLSWSMLFARHEERETFPFLLLFIYLHLRCLIISKSCTLSLKTTGVCCLEILVFPIQLEFLWGENKNFKLKAFSELLILISRVAFARYFVPSPRPHLNTLSLK